MDRLDTDCTGVASLRPGDLVQVVNPFFETENKRGILISLNGPPRGQLQIYDAQVLINGEIKNFYKRDLYRIST